MIDIKISKELKEKSPEVTLGCIQCEVVVIEKNNELWNKINEAIYNIQKNLDISMISKLENIALSRRVYKSLGHDPTRYRLSSEGLLRRILKNKGLYQVNNVVDINNLISILSYYPVCTYDLKKIKPPITFKIGTVGEGYDGIGRGKINIGNLPTFYDELGAFGSTTSDSERGKVTLDTNNILLMIVSFNGEDNLKNQLDLCSDLLKKYAFGKNIEVKIIK